MLAESCQSVRLRVWLRNEQTRKGLCLGTDNRYMGESGTSTNLDEYVRVVYNVYRVLNI